MPQFLDLDTLHVPLGEVQLGGATYALYPLSVKQLINLSVFERDHVSAGTDQQISMALGLLTEVLPGCPRDQLEALNITQLNALMTWVQGLGQEGAAKNSQPALAETA